VTVRRSRYRSLASLQRDNRVCRACAEAGFRLESWPVLEGRLTQKAYILGQAPGSVEAAERRPWRGRAGQTLRQWLRLDEDEFYGLFYCASVMRCYPGRSPTGRGDRAPTPREQDLCRFWREWEFRLLQPRLIVPVGILAAKQLLGIRSLGECIGESFRVGEALALPLPHPSGRNIWLNDRANRARLERATTRIRDELARLTLDGDGRQPPAGSPFRGHRTPEKRG
jgi:uracil-DNA glycosylase